MKKRHQPPDQDVSNGSEPGKPHSRARVRDLDRTWLRARPSRSALACSRAGNPGGINARACGQTGPEKEATVDRTFEGCQNARDSRLTSHITPDILAHTLHHT